MSVASFPLESFGLSNQQLQACHKAGFSIAADILLPSPIDLNKKLRFSRPQQVHDLVAAVSKAIAPSTSRVTELLPAEPEIISARALGKRMRSVGAGAGPAALWAAGGGAPSGGTGWIRTGDAGVDRLLGGGIKLGCLTELAGESAAGKSHFCLSLAVAAQLASLSTRPGGTIFLTSERDISTARLLEIGSWMREIHGRDDFLPDRAMTDNIHSTRAKDVDSLDHALSYAIPIMLAQRNGQSAGGLMGGKRIEGEQEDGAAAVVPRGRQLKPIRLIVLDSITALLRGAETSYSSTASGLSLRSRHLCDIADKLKALAVEYNVAVLVVNQVSDVFSRPTATMPAFSTTNGTEGEVHRSSSPGPNGPGPGASQRPAHSSQWTASQHPGHSQAFYTDGEDPPMRYATQSRWFSGQSESLAKEASLGIVWANAVNTRIMLSRTGRRRLLSADDLHAKRSRTGDAAARTATGQAPDAAESENEQAERMLLRRAHLIFSPFAPPAKIDYVIAPTGIHTVPDSYELDDDGQAIKARAAKRQEAKDALLAQGYDVEDVDGQMLRHEEEYTELPSEFWNEEWEQNGSDAPQGPQET